MRVHAIVGVAEAGHGGREDGLGFVLLRWESEELMSVEQEQEGLKMAMCLGAEGTSGGVAVA